MASRAALRFIAYFVISCPVFAQHGGAPATPPPPEAKQFSFLLGQWDLVVTPAATTLATRIHGVPKLIGTWKAWRALDGFGIEDELRITDETGNPKTTAHALRYYDVAAKHWRATAVEPYRGTISASTSEWRDNMMISTSSGTDSEGKPYVTRTRYYDITPTSFRFRQDRSADEGRSWTEGILSISAQRVAAPAARQ